MLLSSFVRYKSSPTSTFCVFLSLHPFQPLSSFYYSFSLFPLSLPTYPPTFFLVSGDKKYREVPYDLQTLLDMNSCIVVCGDGGVDTVIAISPIALFSFSILINIFRFFKKFSFLCFLLFNSKYFSLNLCQLT